MIAKVFPFHPFATLVIRIVRVSVAGTVHAFKHKVVSIAEGTKETPAFL